MAGDILSESSPTFYTFLLSSRHIEVRAYHPYKIIIFRSVSGTRMIMLVSVFFEERKSANNNEKYENISISKKTIQHLRCMSDSTTM